MNGAYHRQKGSANKEMKTVLKEAHRLGWTVARWRKHCQLTHPDFPHERPFTVPGSPKDPTRTRKQLIKRLHAYPYKTTH